MRRRTLTATGLALLATVGVMGSAMAAQPEPATTARTVLVTPANVGPGQPWSTADTRPGGTVDFVDDSTAPLPYGALRLQTTDSAAKAELLTTVDIPLSQVDKLSYWTKQDAAGFAQGDPSYQLIVA